MCLYSTWNHTQGNNRLLIMSLLNINSPVGEQSEFDCSTQIQAAAERTVELGYSALILNIILPLYPQTDHRRMHMRQMAEDR